MFSKYVFEAMFRWKCCIWQFKQRLNGIFVFVIVITISNEIIESIQYFEIYQ